MLDPSPDILEQVKRVADHSMARNWRQWGVPQDAQEDLISQVVARFLDKTQSDATLAAHLHDDPARYTWLRSTLRNTTFEFLRRRKTQRERHKPLNEGATAQAKDQFTTIVLRDLVAVLRDRFANNKDVLIAIEVIFDKQDFDVVAANRNLKVSTIEKYFLSGKKILAPVLDEYMRP